MEGRISKYSHRTQQGTITGADNADYAFSENQWEAHGVPMPGIAVEFDAQGTTATNIRLASGVLWSRLSSPAGNRRRATAGVLAISVGCLGAHKVYMGQPGVGFLHLLMTGVGLFLWVVPNVVLRDSPREAFLVCLLGWVAVFGLYFAVRKFVFRHSMPAIIIPLRFLWWPLLLFRLPRNLMRQNPGGSATAFILDTLGVTLFVSIAIAIAFAFYVLILLVGYFLIAASIGIGVAEGMTYLRKSDAEFQDEYMVPR